MTVRSQHWVLCLSHSPPAASTPHSSAPLFPPSPSQNGAYQDPHLFFANGGRADFRGRNGVFYNFFSAPDLSVNVKVEDARFLLGNKVTVDGSFITEVHIVARVGGAKRKFANVSFWASELNDQNWCACVSTSTCQSAPVSSLSAARVGAGRRSMARAAATSSASASRPPSSVRS